MAERLCSLAARLVPGVPGLMVDGPECEGPPCVCVGEALALLEQLGCGWKPSRGCIDRWVGLGKEGEGG